MYTIKKTGYVISDTTYHCLTKKVSRITYESRFWKVWRAIITPGTCYDCASINGRILSIDDPRIAGLPVHENCRCYVESITAIVAGTATNAGADGVDLYVAFHGTLPDNYLTQDEAKLHGWKKQLGNLADILHGAAIGGDMYSNWDKRLPDAAGRTWYEADFDYTGGYRNRSRLLFSNDGLLFVTYDHYLNFYEVGRENL